MMIKAFLGLGSNVGDRLQNLVKASVEIAKIEGTAIDKVSPVYETKPFGVKEQNDFYNAVIQITTKLKLAELHKATKRIEKLLGRKKSFRWGPRNIDIDILLFGEAVIEDNDLTVPHKDLLNRDFVLLPLLDICGEFVYPVDQRRVDKNFLNDLDKYVSKEICSSDKFKMSIDAMLSIPSEK